MAAKPRTPVRAAHSCQWPLEAESLFFFFRSAALGLQFVTRMLFFSIVYSFFGGVVFNHGGGSEAELGLTPLRSIPPPVSRILQPDWLLWFHTAFLMDRVKKNSSLFDAHRTSIRSTLLPPRAVRDAMELLLIKQQKRNIKQASARKGRNTGGGCCPPPPTTQPPPPLPA